MVALKPFGKQIVDLVIRYAPPSWPDAQDATQRALDPSGWWAGNALSEAVRFKP